MSRSVIGVFGHTATFDAGCFGFISDITTREDRTKRMGFALGESLLMLYKFMYIHMTRNQINDTFLFQIRVKVKVVGEVSEK